MEAPAAATAQNRELALRCQCYPHKIEALYDLPSQRLTRHESRLRDRLLDDEGFTDSSIAGKGSDDKPVTDP